MYVIIMIFLVFTVCVMKIKNNFILIFIVIRKRFSIIFLPGRIEIMCFSDYFKIAFTFHEKKLV